MILYDFHQLFAAPFKLCACAASR